MDVLFEEKNHKKHKDEVKQIYDEIFNDKDTFVAYYFKEKYESNYMILAKEKGRVVGTMHCNPFSMSLFGEEIISWYVVAVAVKQEYRRRGYMRAMMELGIKKAYEKKLPFIFLMPANTKYYTPFGFVEGEDYIPYTIKGKQESIKKVQGIEGILYQGKEKEEIVSFAKEILKAYKLYTTRSIEYYNRLEKEVQSEEGNICGIRKNQKLIGVFHYAKEESNIVVRELLTKQENLEECIMWISHSFPGKNITLWLGKEQGKDKQEKSLLMFRLVYYEKILEKIKSESPFSVVINITDDIILENNRILKLTVGKNGTKVEETNEMWEQKVTIGELTAWVFGQKELFKEDKKKISLPILSYIHEVV